MERVMNENRKEMKMNGEYGLTPYETREILFYKTDNGDVRVEIMLYQENLWLTQAKMAELFEVQKAAISKHLKNIFDSRELLAGPPAIGGWATISGDDEPAGESVSIETPCGVLEAIEKSADRVQNAEGTQPAGMEGA